MYLVTQKLPQIYTANHATFPIRIRKNTVRICGNFWVTQYISTTGVRVYLQILFLAACEHGLWENIFMGSLRN